METSKENDVVTVEGPVSSDVLLALTEDETGSEGASEVSTEEVVNSDVLLTSVEVVAVVADSEEITSEGSTDEVVNSVVLLTLVEVVTAEETLEGTTIDEETDETVLISIDVVVLRASDVSTAVSSADVSLVAEVLVTSELTDVLADENCSVLVDGTLEVPFDEIDVSVVSVLKVLDAVASVTEDVAIEAIPVELLAESVGTTELDSVLATREELPVLADTSTVEFPEAAVEIEPSTLDEMVKSSEYAEVAMELLTAREEIGTETEAKLEFEEGPVGPAANALVLLEF